MSKPKYLCVVNKVSEDIKNCLNEVPRRGGFFNWSFVFKGDIMAYNDVDDFEKYDIIHLNGSPSDQVLLWEIRRKIGWNSDTKIVYNNDHVCEIWDGFKLHPLHLFNAQRQADMVFGTEPHQASNMIDGAFTMPHPHWIHMLKRFGRRDITESIGYLFHWWESKKFIPTIWSYKLKEQGIKHHSRLYSYMPHADKHPEYLRATWDETISPMNYPEFIDNFITNKLVVDYCGYHTYGRTTVDCAAIGVPMVGSNRIESMNRCFPQLAIDPFDGKGSVELMKRLWKDETFYAEVIDYARGASEYYNYKNCRDRFMSALEEVERRKRK